MRMSFVPSVALAGLLVIAVGGACAVGTEFGGGEQESRKGLRDRARSTFFLFGGLSFVLLASPFEVCALPK